MLSSGPDESCEVPGKRVAPTLLERRERSINSLCNALDAYQWRDGSDAQRMARARSILLLARDLAQAHGVDAMVVIP